jgi:hypothetical protein
MSSSLAPECNPTKQRYDDCFLKWYSESPPVLTPQAITTLTRRPSAFLRTPTAPSTPSAAARAQQQQQLQQQQQPLSSSSSSRSAGGGEDADRPCAAFFDDYQACLWRALKARGVDELVRGARDEARESDADYMRPPPPASDGSKSR